MTTLNFPAVAKAIGKALLVTAALLYLLWYFAPRELIEKRFSLDLTPARGRDIFRIFSGAERMPKFTLAIIEPKDVKPGDVQKLTVQIEDPAGVIEVVAITELDNSTFELPLELVQGNETSGYWTNAWIVRDTHSKTYRTKFVAKNRLGDTNSITLAWTDPCTPPLNGDWTMDSNCSISGVTGADNGNINFTGSFTMTINAGATVAFNSGRQINLSTGIMAVADTSQIRQTNLWITDADGDNHAPPNYSTLAQDSQPAGYSRRWSIARVDDCADTQPNAYVGQTSWFTSAMASGCPAGGCWDYNCSGAIDYQYGTFVSTNECGCADNSATAGWRTSAPGCGGSGTWNLGTCATSGECTIGKFQYTNYVTNTQARTQGCR